MSKTIIVGAGEIGKSLGAILEKVYDVSYKDLDTVVEGKFDVMNICLPYSKNFVEIVKKYQEEYKPELTIIHSTVPVGTTRKLGKGTVHSPVNGKHPNLSKSILTFKKIIGAMSGYDSRMADIYFGQAGINCLHFSSPEASELAKILCTSYYGWNIVYMKEVAKLCEDNNIPFHEVYMKWNENYNNGYKELGDTQFIRPILQPMKGKIGGHCVINNTFLLKSNITKIIRELDDLLS